MKRLVLLALALSSCDPAPSPNQTAPMHHGYALDGDTFEAGRDFQRVRYRLARIDAPELPGHCRRGRYCVPGDPWAAQAELQDRLDDGVSCAVSKRDYYRRWLAECWTEAGDNLNDLLMREGYAKRYRR